MSVEQEAANIIAPCKNTPSFHAQAVIPFSAARTEVVDLKALFGPNPGHFFTVTARTELGLFALGHRSGLLGPVYGTGLANAQQGYPIPADAEKHFKLRNVWEPGTGVGTPSAAGYTLFRADLLHVRAASGSTATGFLHIHRSSMRPTQGEQKTGY